MTGHIHIHLYESDIHILTLSPLCHSSLLQDCVGYVMGKGGQVLRSMEEEWGTLMFFAKTKDSSGNQEEGEILAIFGGVCTPHHSLCSA